MARVHVDPAGKRGCTCTNTRIGRAAFDHAYATRICHQIHTNFLMN
jgi:hypothetical protein